MKPLVCEAIEQIESVGTQPAPHGAEPSSRSSATKEESLELFLWHIFVFAFSFLFEKKKIQCIFTQSDVMAGLQPRWEPEVLESSSCLESDLCSPVACERSGTLGTASGDAGPLAVPP